MSSPDDDGASGADSGITTREMKTRLEPLTLGSLEPASGSSDGTSPPQPPSADRYALGALIGRGGMGEVRVARDTRLGRDVAVKVLRDADHHNADLRARFLREARVQGLLEHPAIVPVHDLGIDEAGHPFFAMKRLTGMTLADILARSPHDAQIAARWPRRVLLARLVDVCNAIEFAHLRGVIHRDIKPQNIMLGELGEVYVLDWGIARLVGDVAVSSGGASGAADDDSTISMTGTGDLVGTPGYMSPEQVESPQVDRRSDVYSLGCVLFEILTLQPALPRGAAAFEAALATDALAPRDRAPHADVPPELDALCALATKRELGARLGSAAALAEGIQRFLDGDRDLAQRHKLADELATAAEAQLAVPLTDATRMSAMQNAGRALALDPTHARAQAIVGRLLLEPPTKVPAAVARAIDEHRDTTGRLHFRTAGLTYASYIAFLPFLLFVHVRHAWPILGVLAIVAINTSVLVTIARRAHPKQVWLAVVLGLHGVLLVLCGAVVSPLLILPAMTAVSLGAFMSNPRVTRWLPVFLVHIAAMLLPIALELAHVLPSTFTLDGYTLSISLWSLDLSARWLLVVIALAGLVQLISNAVMIGRLRNAEEAAQAEIQLYKWHLQQIVPTTAG